MKAVSKILTGAAAAAALTVGAAAPAAAQYYPGGGYGGGGLGDVLVGAVLNNILRGGNPGGYNGYYGVNNYNLERAAVDQCARAAEQRVNGGGYGYNNGYGYGGYNGQYGGYNQGYQNAGYRTVNIDRVNRTRNGNMRVYGVLSSNAYQGNYGYGYNQGGYNQPYGGYGYNQPAQNLSFNCKFERNGRISDLKIRRM